MCLPNIKWCHLVGDQQAKTWSIGVVGGHWRLGYFWRIKGPSSIILSQAKSAGLCCSTLYPMFLLAVTCAYIMFTLKVACTLACVRFCTFLLFVCVVLSTYFFWVIKYVYVGLHTIYLCWALLLLFDILSCWLFFLRDYWTIPFWGSDMLCALHNWYMQITRPLGDPKRKVWWV